MCSGMSVEKVKGLDGGRESVEKAKGPRMIRAGEVMGEWVGEKGIEK